MFNYWILDLFRINQDIDKDVCAIPVNCLTFSILLRVIERIKRS